MSEEYERAIRNEIDYWPGVQVEFSARAKHAQAILRYQGQTRFIVFPTSSSDSRRGALNCLADARKEMKALGATKLERKPAKRKRIHKVAGTRRPDRPMQIEAAPVKANPFDALAGYVVVQAEPPAAPPQSLWSRARQFIHSLFGARQ